MSPVIITNAEWVALQAARDRVAHLSDVIERAPHAHDCSAVSYLHDASSGFKPGPCDCWKRDV